MKINIKNVEKTSGLVFKKRFYGVETTVIFTEEEKAIIKERNLNHVVIMERDIPADVDPDKHANRSMITKVASLAMKGAGAGHFHMMPSKLMRGPDTYYMTNQTEVKNYIDELKGALTELKAMIEDNIDGAEDTSFEL